MPTFKLIVDSEQADAFAHLSRPVELENMRLTRFVWEDKELPDSVRNRILLMNQSEYTCFCLPKKDWRIMFFDLDSTVIRQESIVELARAAGKEEEVSRITEQAMAGLLDFTSALRERVRMLQGLPATVVGEVAERLTINPGMHEFAAKAKERGILLYLVSGGFNPLAELIASELGFHGYMANDLEVKDGFLSGELRGEIVNAEMKAQYLKETCARLRVPEDLAIVVGDGANDLLMMQAAGASIGYFPKKVLLPHINGANFHDHRALTPILIS